MLASRHLLSTIHESRKEVPNPTLAT